MKAKKHLGGLIAIAVILTLGACKKELTSTSPGSPQPLSDMISEKGQNPDEAVFGASNLRDLQEGYLYTESNESGTNNILIYDQHPDGTLSLDGMTASGGAGAGAGLGSQGAVVLDATHSWLYAVNAGDNSVSSFEVHSDGSLTLAHTESSGGTLPISVTVYGNYLYVVNSATSNINGYTIGAGGTLTTMAGSNQSLSSSTAGPAQILFSPNGAYLYVTEKMTNMITAFQVDAMGVAMAGISSASVGQTPFGFQFGRDNSMIVSNAAGGNAGEGSATSYWGANTGSLSDVNGAVADLQAAPCWVATTHYGSLAFLTNTATDNISSYYVAPGGKLFLIQEVAASAGDAPTDISVAGNNYYVYNINSMSHTISRYNRMPLGGLNHIDDTADIPTYAAGLAAY